MQYVILAAGQGSRFTKEGVETPKPLVEILGTPMIERLVNTLMQHDASRINIVANSDMPALVDYLERMKSSGLPLDIRPILSDNSYWSLSQAAEGLEGKFIAMTVDTIFKPEEFGKYVRAVEEMAEGEVVMGLTRFCDDPSPLYAKLDANGEVADYRYGGEPFDDTVIVSAGLYGLDYKAMETVRDHSRYPESLSDFQKILAAETPIHVKVFEFEKALDVDDLHDRSIAEEFLLQQPIERKC